MSFIRSVLIRLQSYINNVKFNVFKHILIVKLFELIMIIFKWIIYILLSIGLCLGISGFPFLLEKLTQSDMKIGDWSNYFSNIFGAVIALLGVFFTLEHQKNYFNRLPYKDQIKIIYNIIDNCRKLEIRYNKFDLVIKRMRLPFSTRYNFFEIFQKYWDIRTAENFSNNFGYTSSSIFSQFKLIEKSRGKQYRTRFLSHRLHVIDEYFNKCSKSIDYLNRVNNIFRTSPPEYKMRLYSFNLIKHNLLVLFKYMPHIYRQNKLIYKTCEKLLK